MLGLQLEVVKLCLIHMSPHKGGRSVTSKIFLAIDLFLFGNLLICRSRKAIIRVFDGRVWCIFKNRKDGDFWDFDNKMSFETVSMILMRSLISVRV